MSEVPEHPFIPSMIGMLHDVDVSTTVPAAGDSLVAGPDKIWRPSRNGGGVNGARDRYVISNTTTTDYALSYVPIANTVNLFLNGIALDEGVDYSVDYVTPQVILTASASRAVGDVLWARYLSLDPASGQARIVQTAINGKNGGGTSIVATFASTPTPGNILVWIVSFYSPRATVPNPGTGWTEYVASTQGNAAVNVYTYTVQPGDGRSWEMDEVFGTDAMSACIVEVADSDGIPSGWGYPTQGVSVSPLSQSVTETAGKLLIVGVCPNGGSADGLTDITPSGHTEDREFIPTNSSLNVGHTTATGSAQSIGASWDGSNGDCVQVVIVVTGV